MLDIDDEVLTQAHSAALKVASDLIASPVDADAIAQQAMLTLLQQPAVPINVDAWITTTTRSLAEEHWHASSGLDDLDDQQAGGLLARDEVVQFIRAGGGVSETALTPAAIDHVYARLVQSLSEREVEVLLMLADGCTHAEIALDLGYRDAASVQATVHKIRGKAITLAAEFGTTPEGSPPEVGSAPVRSSDG